MRASFCFLVGLFFVLLFVRPLWANEQKPPSPSTQQQIPNIKHINPRIPWFQPKKTTTQSKSLHGSQMQKNAVLAKPKAYPKEKPPDTDSSLFGSNYSFDYDTERTSWNAPPTAKKRLKPDETIGIHEQHRIRAHTHLTDSKNLDITAGPELILKNTPQRPAIDSTTSQPDSELGLGMQFHYKF
ncbi:MAG: hypothetical protein IJS54_03660 [Desulfovibrio sp.]|nr:hypothetical protein [Desulfovibrio sp.]